MSEIKTSYVAGSKVIVFDGAEEKAEFTLDGIPAEVIDGMALGFMQRVARERTAGKVDDPAERKAAIESIRRQVQAWQDGKLEVERASKVELTPEEIQAATLDFIVSQKRARGDARPENEIKGAFLKLAEAKRNEVLAALKKPLTKHLKQRLAAKRGNAKADW